MKQPFFAVLALTVLASCVVYPQTHHGDGVGVVQEINVPRGMELKTNLHQSYTVREGNYRDERLVYEGQTPLREVADFLRKEMSQRTYSLAVKESEGEDHEHLVFKHGIHTADCVIRRNEFNTRLVILVSTSLQH